MDAQPGKQIGVLCRREIAREGLVKVMMCIHQAGKKNHLPRIDYAIGVLWKRICRPDLPDHIPLHVNTPVCPARIRIVHRYDECRMPNEQ